MFNFILAFILPFLCLSKIEIPKMSFLFVDEDIEEEDIDRLKSRLNDLKESMKKECSKVEDKDEKELCNAVAKCFLGIEGSNGQDLSKKISKIDKKTDILFYAGTTVDQTIDFSKLKSQMVVIMIRPPTYSSFSNKVDFYAKII